MKIKMIFCLILYLLGRFPQIMPNPTENSYQSFPQKQIENSTSALLLPPPSTSTLPSYDSPSFVFQAIINRNKIGNMQRKTRSLRNIEHCNQIRNIFHRRDGVKELLSIIPQAIAKQISSTQNISCSFVDKLQAFAAETDLQDELCFAANAALFQNQWIKAIQTNNIVGEQPHQGLIIRDNQSYYALPGSTALSSRQGHKKLEIWQNSQFLQRLNEFIMGEPSEIKYFQPQDSLLEK